MRKAAVRRAMGKQDTRCAFFCDPRASTRPFALSFSMCAAAAAALGAQAQEYNSSALGYFIYFAH
jgi:hypothetical protein